MMTKVFQSFYDLKILFGWVGRERESVCVLYCVLLVLLKQNFRMQLLVSLDLIKLFFSLLIQPKIFGLGKNWLDLTPFKQVSLIILEGDQWNKIY